jgi:site-specific DNA-methyltransferase (adenine-specific)
MFDIVSGLVLPGQSILDPFCGAGTTGIAAVKHGCLFDGIEIDAENCKIATTRIGGAA